MTRAASLLWRASCRLFSNHLQPERLSVNRSFYGHVRNITSVALGGQNRSLTRCRIFQSPSFLLQKFSPIYPLSPSPFILHPQQCRGLVKVSKKKGKRKTVKAVAKRFHRTGSGKLKYWPAGKVHNMLSKSKRKRRQLRKPRYASKTQLKTLNKMLAGW